MHISTFNFLKQKIEVASKIQVPVHYNGIDMVFDGVQIIIDNDLKPTIDEGKAWIFPKEKFVTYEKSDEEWCRYFGIGRQGQGLIMGDILHKENKHYNYIANILLDKTPIRTRSTVMTNLGPVSSWN